MEYICLGAFFFIVCLFLPAKDIAIDMPIKHKSKPYLMISLPDNATNGDIIKAVFDVTEVRQLDCCAFIDTSDDANMRTYKDWWNAPYKEGE